MAQAVPASSAEAAEANTHSAPRNVVSGLSCLPGAVHAGNQIICELRATTPVASRIQLFSTSDAVRVPAVVETRAGQTHLNFQASIDPAARQQVVTLTATLDGDSVQNTFLVTAASTPTLHAPGKQFVKAGARVNFQVEAADPADMAVQLAAANLPPGATFDPLTGRFEWKPEPSQIGKYQISFTATNVARQSSTGQVAIDVDSGKPVLDPEDEVCSPGAIGIVRGKWLLEGAGSFADPSGNSEQLGGSSLKANGVNLPILSIAADKINFLCPMVDPGTELSLSVATDAGVSGPIVSTMQRATPQIFSLDGISGHQGAVSFPHTANVAIQRNFRIAGYPAQPGDSLLIWSTGFGAGSDIAGAVSVTLGGINAEILSVRPVEGNAGLYAIEVRVPDGVIFGDNVPVQLQVSLIDGSKATSNSVTIAAEPAGQ